MIRVVLDTSVLVAAVISPAGPNAQVLTKIVTGELRPYVTDAVTKARFIVTENTRHFPRPHAYTTITTARQLLKRMERGER